MIYIAEFLEAVVMWIVSIVPYATGVYVITLVLGVDISPVGAFIVGFIVSFLFQK